LNTPHKPRKPKPPKKQKIVGKTPRVDAALDFDAEMAAFFSDIAQQGLRLRIHYGSSCSSAWSAPLDSYLSLPLANLEDVPLCTSTAACSRHIVGAH